jgi:hypothetical protein
MKKQYIFLKRKNDFRKGNWAPIFVRLKKERRKKKGNEKQSRNGSPSPRGQQHSN